MALLSHTHMTGARRSGERGFSLAELLITMAIGVTLAAIAVPVIGNVVESTKLNQATRLVERELQTARLKAVSLNRPMRVRFNCPAPAQLRMVEVTGISITDDSTDRCNQTLFPYPSTPDNDPTTPQADGPIQYLDQATVTGTFQIIEFRSNGTAWSVDGAGTATAINGEASFTVTRQSKTKVVLVNAL
jgi:prepilin-type N-terminal cleavage/methylation domain-containing protein